MLIRAAAFALALLLPAAAFAQPTPREVVDRTAKAIEDLYFDPAKGKAIAADLRKEAAAGKYDALTDPRDLATALSTRLRPLDHHFNVAWQPGQAGPAPAGPGGPGGPPGAGGPPSRPVYGPATKRGNYGFKKVEMLPGGVGYIQLNQFVGFAGDGDGPKAAADAALTLLANADALIIDLRDNGGGSPAMVGYLVSAFTPKDAEIYNVFHSREGTEDEKPPVFYANPRLDTPVYILTSGRTGSAGEALPYTLQAAKRATIVGEATGGAANPGGPAPLGDGYSIFISRGSPVNPITKSNWEGAGVQPDVKVPAADALEVAQTLALETILAKGGEGPVAQDSRWALEALKARKAPPAYVKADYLGSYGDVAIAEEDGRLVVKRGRRPAWAILPVARDVFYAEADPGRRVVFERDASGKVVAFEIVGSLQPGGQRLRRE
ncbi:MAG TPA: S41 family peptidase [Caulobacter sp.]|nr:S41 family peptidase [Caulobacter sp.]